MYRKDLITAETQKLAQVLARIMGLKLDGKPDEALALFNQTLENSFELPVDILEDQPTENFSKWLHHQQYSPEKLDALSEFLYYELGSSAEGNTLIAPKLNILYQHLADHHKIVHLVNFHRQQTIQQYL